MIDIREKKGQKLADLNDEIQIDGAIALLHHVRHKNKYVLDALMNVGLVDSPKIRSARANYTSNEKRIATIAMKDQLKSLLNKGKPRMSGDRELLEQHLFATYGFPDQGIRYYVTKTYNKFKRRIVEKIARINTNKDVAKLAQKYPDIDIVRLVSYAVTAEKIDYTKEDLQWLDEIIQLIKQGNQ
jgi:hypothetical protein